MLEIHQHRSNSCRRTMQTAVAVAAPSGRRSKQTWCSTSTDTIRLIRDGEKGGKGLWMWCEREIIYLSLHCHHQNDTCIKIGSDESHFNVSVGSDGQSHRTVSTNHNLFEKKGEPKRYRTEVLPLTNLTPYR